MFKKIKNCKMKLKLIKSSIFRKLNWQSLVDARVFLENSIFEKKTNFFKMLNFWKFEN